MANMPRDFGFQIIFKIRIEGLRRIRWLRKSG